MSDEERIEIIQSLTDILNPKDTKCSDPFNRIVMYFYEFYERLPPLIYEIKNRIIKKENLVNCFEEPHWLPHFVGLILPGGKIQRHTDINFGDLIHIRVNVFLLQPHENFKTYYDDNVVNCDGCTYVICRSGMDYHWTDTNIYSLPRIFISFGFLLPKSKVIELLPEITTMDSFSNVSNYYNSNPCTLENLNWNS